MDKASSTIADFARDEWRSHLLERDWRAQNIHGRAAVGKVASALGYPAMTFSDARAYESLGDRRWVGNVVVNTADESVTVLAAPVDPESDPADVEMRLFAVVDGQPVAPPFMDLLGLGRALETGMAYDDWVEAERPGDATI